MQPSTALSVLEQAAADLADLALGGPLDAPVPPCPGWTVLDLVRHVGGIHRWALEALTVGKPGREPAGPSDPAEVVPWLRAGATQLVETLRSCDPEQGCWTFGPPRTARFWMRRQAHETTVHAWDAACARGVHYDIDDGLAWDGVDEVATMFLPRQVRLGRLATGPEVVELRAESGFRTVLATVQDGRGPVTATVTGPSAALLLLLWKRASLGDPRLNVGGRAHDAERLLALPLTP